MMTYGKKNFGVRYCLPERLQNHPGTYVFTNECRYLLDDIYVAVTCAEHFRAGQIAEE